MVFWGAEYIMRFMMIASDNPDPDHPLGNNLPAYRWCILWLQNNRFHTYLVQQ